MHERVEDHPIDREAIRAAVLARAGEGGRSSARARTRLRPLAAALALLLVLGGFSGYALALEAKEYGEAVAFFEEHNLSPEGLSRADIKRVYRDIATGRFLEGKTAQVIEKNVAGYEIFQEQPAPADLALLWQAINERLAAASRYEIVHEERFDEARGFDVHAQSCLVKYVDGSEVWRAAFKGVVLEDYAPVGGALAVWGYTPRYASWEKSTAFLALVDESGKDLWRQSFDNGFSSEYIAAVMPEQDGLAVFSRGDLAFLCLSRYDRNGARTAFAKTEVGNYGIWNAARLGDGFLVQLGNASMEPGEFLLKVNADGTLSDSFTYASKAELYFITDMIEYAGGVYLSAYAVPRVGEGESAGGRYDIAPVLNVIFANGSFEISNEELTRLMRENFTAVLLACDPISGVPQEFYSVQGSMGGALSLGGDGTLLWDVESISEAEFSLATSAYSIRGASLVYRYAFDAAGNLASREDTGEIVPFWR